MRFMPIKNNIYSAEVLKVIFWTQQVSTDLPTKYEQNWCKKYAISFTAWSPDLAND